MLFQQAATAPWPSGSWNAYYEAAAAACLRRARGQSWYVVWCHERVHKEEYRACRTLLHECLAPSQGQLLCLKKPIKFQEHLQRELSCARSARRPYVLITDWREAKPCMTILEFCADNPPELFAILCQNTKQASRARSWAGTVSKGRNLPVCVIDPLDPVKNEMKEPMTGAPDICSSCVGLCLQLTGAVLQPHSFAPHLQNIRTSPSFAACCERRPPLLQVDVRESARSLAERCKFAKQPTMRSQLGARTFSASVEVPAQHIHSASTEGTGSTPRLDDIVNNCSLGEIASMLGGTGLYFYED